MQRSRRGGCGGEGCRCVSREFSELTQARSANVQAPMKAYECVTWRHGVDMKSQAGGVDRHGSCGVKK
eukprot:4876657-Pleurochrysis_carterae.AAC.2